MLMFIDKKQALFTLQDLNIAGKKCNTFKFNEVKFITQETTRLREFVYSRSLYKRQINKYLVK